jgi:RNA recognition motif-containing protein
MNIYVGNLPRTVTEDQLKDKFREIADANVSSVKIIKDKFTGESRGFGFLDINDTAEAQRAIDTMNGYELDGRKLIVNEARGPERSGERPPRSGGSGGRGGFGGPRSSNGNFGGGSGGFRKNRF